MLKYPFLFLFHLLQFFLSEMVKLLWLDLMSAIIPNAKSVFNFMKFVIYIFNVLPFNNDDSVDFSPEIWILNRVYSLWLRDMMANNGRTFSILCIYCPKFIVKTICLFVVQIRFIYWNGWKQLPQLKIH